MKASYLAKVGTQGIYLTGLHGEPRASWLRRALAQQIVDKLGGDQLHLPIYYRDTVGQWDELEHKHGVFLDFSSGVSELAQIEMKELGLT